MVKRTSKTVQNSILDFVSLPVTLQDGYYNSSGVFVALGGFKATSINVVDSDKIKVSCNMSGGATQLAVFMSSSGQKIGQFGTGTNGVSTQYTDYLLDLPQGTSSIKLSSQGTSGIAVKKGNVPEFVYKQEFEQAIDTLEEKTQKLSDFVTLPVTLQNGYYNNNGVFVPLDNFKATSINVVDSDKIKVSCNMSGGATQLAVFMNSSGQKIGQFGTGTNGVNTPYLDHLLVLPQGTAIINLSSAGGGGIIVKKESLISQIVSVDYLDSKIVKLNDLKGKTFLWLGTSIPQGGQYPEISAQNLEGICINKAVGSSMVRKAKFDGTYNGLAWQNKMYCLTDTIAEKQALITDWANTRLILTNTPPETLTQSQIDFILSCSYENRILPYLNGTFSMPDVFVLDHGHNDNLSSDTDAQFQDVPATRNDKNTFIGAMNFICDLILQYNPHARIVLIGHYENARKTRISVAQQNFANHRNFPFLKMWEKTGWSQTKIAGTAALWSIAPYSNYAGGQDTTQDMTTMRVWNPDDLHPATDTSGKAQALLADLTTSFFRTI